MAEDGGDFIASWSFHTHEVGTGALYQVLLLVLPLLLFWRGMKEVLCKRHVLVAEVITTGNYISYYKSQYHTSPK